METIVMSQKELKHYRLAMDVIEDKISMSEFSELIGKSYRQARRVVKKVREKGVKGSFHGNKGRPPHNKTDPKKLRMAMILLRTKYRDFNLTHFAEKLEEEEGISLKKDVIHRRAKKERLVKNPKRRHRRTYRSRPRLPKEGMMIQFDGSCHNWFGDIVCDLIAGIDDATGKVLAAEFFHGEKSLHSMKVIREIIDNNGIPESFYMDKASIYGKVDQDWESQIARAFEHTGVQLILAGSSQAKGRIERLWRTFQDRLIAELRLAQIDTLEEANKFLKEVFLPNYNLKFSVEAQDAERSYRKNIFGDLDLIYCKKDERKISPGNCFSWKSTTWLITEKHSYAGRRININTHINGSYSFDIMGRKVQAEILVPKRMYNYKKKAG